MSIIDGDLPDPSDDLPEYLPWDVLKRGKYFGLNLRQRTALGRIGYRHIRSGDDRRGLVGITCLALAHYHRAAATATARGDVSGFPSYGRFWRHFLASEDSVPPEVKASWWFPLIARPIPPHGSYVIAGAWRPDEARQRHQRARTDRLAAIDAELEAILAEAS